LLAHRGQADIAANKALSRCVQRGGNLRLRSLWEGSIMTSVKLSRRRFLHLAAGAAALPAVSHIARAQTYPTRPVRIIVPFAAGAVNDITARLTAQWLSERLGQSFVIENRPGGGANIGIEAVVHAPADGYTLLAVGTTAAINATLFEKLNYNFIRDTAPIASIMRVPHVMQVNPTVPVTTVPEFIAYAKANPGKVSMGSGGNGSPAHVIGEHFKMITGVNLVHVPYRGGAPALTDLIGGQIQVAFIDMAASIEYIRAGKLRALGVTTAMRSEALPDTPAIGDFVPGFEASQWVGLHAPKNTPSDPSRLLSRGHPTVHGSLSIAMASYPIGCYLPKTWRPSAVHVS
jgi:tripartite-type tricarboxylate transporter receptor subunit TctC